MHDVHCSKSGPLKHQFLERAAGLRRHSLQRIVNFVGDLERQRLARD
jgi:hypothetical protein